MYEEPAEEKPPAQDRKNVEILMQAIDEMKKLGFDSLEEYLAYKDEQSLKEMKKLCKSTCWNFYKANL